MALNMRDRKEGKKRNKKRKQNGNGKVKNLE
jgi:hypothetical protein